MNNSSDNSENEFSEETQIQFCESKTGFDASLMIKQELLSKVKATKLELSKEKIFRMPSFVSALLKRKNEIFYFVNTCEMHVDIKDTTGSVYLPLITKSEINKNLQKINPKIRSKISMVHLGAIKILLKAEFQEGINSPVKMALIDNRINDRKDCILGAARGNLAYQKFMFTVYPKFGLSLDSKNLDQVLSFVHQFERTDLMNEGDKVFSITYLIGYALTNSHHSIDYKKSEYIELEDVFSEIGSVEDKKFSEIDDLNSSWAIDIAKDKKILGQKPTARIKGNNLEIGEPNTRNTLKSMSRRIDNLSQILKNITEKMSNPLIINPHIYKKGKILNFKKLNEGNDKAAKKYIFSGNTASIPTLVNQCNNLNQIVGRNWLGIHKLLSYFGISKDPSEKLSKTPTNFNKFWSLLREGDKDKKDLKELKILLEKQNSKLKDLENKIEELSKPKDPPITRPEVLDFTEKLKEIDDFLRQILGKE